MSTSSNASSPASSDAPRALAPLVPSSANRPIAKPPNESQNGSILTHKEWVVPPRPKPGRKPATDTPPTKRKAQNRAAQRAFRERRASKVGELEELMKIMEEEDEREQQDLRNQIQRLEMDLEKYNHLLISYSERLMTMESELKNERLMRENMQSTQRDLKIYQTQSTDAVPLPPRVIPREKSHTKAQTSYEDPNNENPVGCGKCNINSRCECFEQAFNLNNLDTNIDLAPKRPHSPIPLRDSKRLRQDDPQELNAEEEEYEIDFTTKYPPSQPLISNSASSMPALPSSNNVVEPCGFCTDNTACLCAELASGTPIIQGTDRHTAPLVSQSSDTSKYITPDTLPNFSYSRSTATGSNPCANGPGTCPQCLSNPTSTLFCKSLAATRSPGTSSLKPAAPTDRCTGCTDPNSCCQNSTSTSQPPAPPRTQVIAGPTLTCADAFTTLSRHPAFDRASDELGAWLPQLATVPKEIEGRSAFEIEAASVMGVLRFFDRRFGKEKEEGRKV